jgi:hypothetical protein
LRPALYSAGLPLSSWMDGPLITTM